MVYCMIIGRLSALSTAGIDRISAYPDIVILLCGRIAIAAYTLPLPDV